MDCDNLDTRATAKWLKIQAVTKTGTTAVLSNRNNQAWVSYQRHSATSAYEHRNVATCHSFYIECIGVFQDPQVLPRRITSSVWYT